MAGIAQRIHCAPPIVLQRWYVALGGGALGGSLLILFAWIEDSELLPRSIGILALVCSLCALGFAGVMAAVGAAQRRRMHTLAATHDGQVCGHCEYLLEGIDGQRCPECGHAFDRAKLASYWQSDSQRYPN